MFNPQMMQQAAQMMSSMTPEQRSAFQSMAANMDPAMIARMSGQMNMPGISEEHIRRAQSQMQNRSGEDLAATASAYARAQATAPATSSSTSSSASSSSNTSTKSSSSSNPAVNEARKLKDQGNDLHNAQKHSKAIESYNAALEKLQGVSEDAEADDVRRSCRLNLAAGYLALKQDDKVIEICSDLIATGERNKKAFFRRALARERGGQLREALEDLYVAQDLAPGEALIDSAITRIQSQLGIAASRAQPTKSDSPVSSTNVSRQNSANPGAQNKPKAANKPATPETKPTTSPMPPGMPNISEADISGFKESVRSNPELFRSQQRQVLAMSDAQLEQMGMPPTMARQQAQMMLSMTDEQILACLDQTTPAQAMQRMQQAAGGKKPTITPEMAQAAQNMARSNPAMVRQQSQQVLSMTDEQLEQLGVPPSMARAQAKMMSQMTDEQLVSTLGMASSMYAGSPSSGSASASGSAASATAATPAATPTAASVMSNPDAMKQAQEMMKNPEMLKSMGEMLGNMDPATLDMMSKQSGMKITPEMARSMSQKLQTMSPQELEAMSAMMPKLQAVVQFFQDLYRKLFGSWFRLAIVVAIVAIVLGHIFNLF